MEQLHPSEIDLGLERIAKVAARLEISKPGSKVITVAGTNGKGSCIAVLEALLQSQGKTCGAYTSPHLLRYNERIRVNSEEADDVLLVDAFSKINSARKDISLTYFEFGTLAAFYIFSKLELDFWLLEVGLGGRLDAVNLIDPDLAVITSIDLDHQDWLGETREEIAAEKAGILRDSIPCVCAEPAPSLSLTKAIRDHANHCFYIGSEFSFEGDCLKLQTINSTSLIEGLICSLPPASVAAACQVAAYFDLLPEQEVLKKTLASLGLNGRFQEIESGGFRVFMDVAHNPAAAVLLADRLKLIKAENGQSVNAVVGMMADKAILETLEPLAQVVDNWVTVDLPGIGRAASASSLADALKSLNVAEKIEQVDGVGRGFEALFAKFEGKEKPVIIVFGSFFTVAAALDYFNSIEK